MNRILLFLEHRENRHLLAEYLGRQYEVIQAEGKQDLDSPFDLGILDGLALDRFFEPVMARKKAEQSVFLPFLLVASRPDVGMVTRYLWRTVDELILTPIVPVELQARVEILLRARRLSQESEARYYALAENSPAGIFIVQDERIVYANPGLRETIGRPDEEITELCFLAEDREKVLVFCHAQCQERAEGKKLKFCEMRIITSGGVRWMELGAAAIVYRGRPAILCIALDFTERKRAEEDLEKYRSHLEEMVTDRTVQLTKANEQLQQEIGERKQAEVAAQSAYNQLNQIFDAAGDGMCVLDRELRVVRLNQTLCTLLSLSREEVVGKDCLVIFGCSLFGSLLCPTTRILSCEKRVEC
ncbi:MAG: hypothetical protein QG605_253, partial [Euryarchaeota archaeon]|nr:hypothetical protein [Euryarchaeota archaeon]